MSNKTTFRIFISSTFTDMKVERKILHENVFPRLESYCRRNGLNFQTIDLRWGVNEEAQLNHETLDICLNEIALCQSISPRPNFIAILGNKYGWQPVPSKIDIKIWNRINELLASTEDIDFIKTWYKLDENASPPEYVLQPRVNEFVDWENWSFVENKLRLIIQNSLNQEDCQEEKKCDIILSATHHEIYHGIFNQIKNEEDSEHFFVFDREINNTNSKVINNVYFDTGSEEMKVHTENQLSNLKKELIDLMGTNGNYISYRVALENDDIKFEDNFDFEEVCYQKLKNAIDRQKESIVRYSDLDQELLHHAHLKNEVITNYIERGDILQQVKGFVDDDLRDKRVYTITGDTGSGKTSVMAKLIDELQGVDDDIFLIYRFMGTSENSSNLFNLLRSIILQLERDMEVQPEIFPSELAEVIELFDITLQKARLVKPVVLILDAIDQLSTSEYIEKLLSPPLNVKIILSTLPNNAIIDKIRKWTILEELPQLTQSESDAILTQLLNSNGRDLQDSQKEYVLSLIYNTPNPLYLKLLFRIVLNWRSYDEVTELPNSLDEIIINYIQSLESKHGKKMVEAVVCYILSSRYYGLTESQLMNLLVFDTVTWESIVANTHPDHINELLEQQKIPTVVWSRLYKDLEPFIARRSVSGIPIISFFHRQFYRVLSKYYKLNDFQEKNNIVHDTI